MCEKWTTITTLHVILWTNSINTHIHRAPFISIKPLFLWNHLFQWECMEPTDRSCWMKALSLAQPPPQKRDHQCCFNMLNWQQVMSERKAVAAHAWWWHLLWQCNTPHSGVSSVEGKHCKIHNSHWMSIFRASQKICCASDQLPPCKWQITSLRALVH